MITNNKHYSTNNLNIINSSPSINTIPQNIQLLSNQPSNVSNHNTISPYNIQDLISLTTLNTRGLNESIKLKSLTNSVNNRSILFCTETKLKKDTTYPKHINGRSIIYGNSNSAKNGTALIIGKDLSSHVFKITQTTEYCSSIILRFKGKVDILMTALYLPHDKKERRIASKFLYQSIRDASIQKLHHIILGDFNSYPKDSPSIGASTTSDKQSIYKYLNNYIDIGHHFGKNNYTHFTSTSASRIDQVWVSKNLASKVIWYKVSECDTIPTDHRIVSIKLDWFEFKKTKTIYKFDIERTSQENLINFTKDIEL
jgi:exonuclease III